jgi:SAM-dependent methyltransferase
LGIVPTPMLESFSIIGARALIGATKLGLFEAVATKALTAGEIAAQCHTDPELTRKLLNYLAASGYFQRKDGRYSLTPLSRKWLLQDAPKSLHDSMLMRLVEWDFIGHMEEVVRTGEPLDIHRHMSDEEWKLYQRSMRSSAAIFGGESVQRTPVPKGARDMLDIGGSHGYYSVALCRRHPGLRSTVLDLPEAVAQAAPILARERMGDRVVHRAGNALTDDFGAEAFDLALISNLVHIFDEAGNRDLVCRAARALRPGGYLVIQDQFRKETDDNINVMGAIGDLYMALMGGGAWSAEEMADWQRTAGLMPQKPIHFRTLPGTGQQYAIKPAA